MGMPLSELAERMTAEEFGQHLALERREPLGAQTVAFEELLAALANGELKPPPGRNAWRAADFHVEPWAPAQEPAPDKRVTKDDIRSGGRAAGLPFL